MKKIIENIDELMIHREGEIYSFLKPVIPSGMIEKRNISVDIFNQSNRREKKIIFSVVSRGNNPENYEDRTFPLASGDYRGTYYEVWIFESNQTLYLERAYFHIYKLEMTVDDVEERRYLYLHCDPNEEDETHLPYKLTPHLHILQHGDVLEHAHIAMHLYKQQELLINRMAMTGAINSALKMVYSQLMSN